MAYSMTKRFKSLVILSGLGSLLLLTAVHLSRDNDSGVSAVDSQRQLLRFQQDLEEQDKTRANNVLVPLRALEEHAEIETVENVTKLNSIGSFQNKININDHTSIVCDVECQRFHAYLDTWPPDKPRAAFYILTTSRRFDQFTKALISIDTNFNHVYDYPIIVFHEKDYSRDLKEHIRNITVSKVFFQEVTFAIPDFLPEPVYHNIPCTSSITYRHMCRFNAKEVFREPTIQSLQYYWRLDDDSLLLNEVTYDVFKFMRDKNVAYGYLWRHLDAMDCVEGLWEATRAYISKKQLQTYFFDSWKSPWLYYNNFEISQVAPWISQEYTEYIEYLDKLGGIYYHRWGDAPIRGIAVSMFLPKTTVHKFKDIGYQHQTFVHKPETIADLIN